MSTPTINTWAELQIYIWTQHLFPESFYIDGNYMGDKAIKIRFEKDNTKSNGFHIHLSTISFSMWSKHTSAYIGDPLWTQFYTNTLAGTSFPTTIQPPELSPPSPPPVVATSNNYPIISTKDELTDLFWRRGLFTIHDQRQGTRIVSVSATNRDGYYLIDLNLLMKFTGVMKQEVESNLSMKTGSYCTIKINVHPSMSTITQHIQLYQQKRKANDDDDNFSVASLESLPLPYKQKRYRNDQDIPFASYPTYPHTTRPVSRLRDLRLQVEIEDWKEFVVDQLYLPVVRIDGLYVSTKGLNLRDTSVSTFYFFEPHSPVLLHLGKTMITASKVHAYCQLAGIQFEKRTNVDKHHKIRYTDEYRELASVEYEQDNEDDDELTNVYTNDHISIESTCWQLERKCRCACGFLHANLSS